MKRRTHHWGLLGLVLCVLLSFGGTSASEGEQLAAYVPSILESPSSPSFTSLSGLSSLSNLPADTAWRQAVPSWPVLAQNDRDDSLNPFRREGNIVGEDRESITGTDPRAFDTLIDVSYRYAEMDNDFMQQDLWLSGQVPLSNNLALTAAFAPLRWADFEDTPTFESRSGSLPDNLGDVPWIGGAGVEASDLDSDGDDFGIGDLKVGVIWRFDEIPNRTADSWERRGDEYGDVLVTLDVWMPTASEDVLGNDAWILTSGLHWVVDTPSNGFVALMNYYDWSFDRDDGRPAVSRLRGQWYIMQPVTELGRDLLDGIYIQPEIQPVYDIEEEEFSFWAGGEIGKVITTGSVVYVKPGWGINPDDGERSFTIELGARFFF
ncbi:MAG: hypothetical protein GX591_05180 [Planctomycetes bacterium]|nr:hypothetical protein [Planctomycetota bacterium]